MSIESSAESLPAGARVHAMRGFSCMRMRTTWAHAKRMLVCAPMHPRVCVRRCMCALACACACADRSESNNTVSRISTKPRGLNEISPSDAIPTPAEIQTITPIQANPTVRNQRRQKNRH